ncbi:gamma-glutamyl-gamma-aminobutyrate hydrolase family protein [Halomonas nitroreducens]|uniref:Gamma-glutamyl-gamma-aminobutyrate hydrolase family protein n=1 Tax=Halomonas nitroreducens TaxID=447425 RepID=A0A431V771_9GAMM|nr:gamma-glutamyl-gamma-aminobutyrate hydrolase family protein [Halomonas nitroreducens]RTR06898.1 gamma-glutamyl-gamma-aminobutyrate hydrolase family protein [Halomonas nitroreducens]
MTGTPIIGITLDIEYSTSYAQEPWYALRENYCGAIETAGGTAIGLPHDLNAIERYLDLVDGVVISGGMYDIPPALYGEEERQGDLVTKVHRTRFEQRLLEGALARDLPVVGICGGMQLIAVSQGAKLIQDLPSEVRSSLGHMQPLPHSEASHSVSLTPGSLLHRLVGRERLEVNSVHHQAIKDVPKHLVVSAVAEDHVIEAIEVPDQRFCIGLQWHPEYLINDSERRVFDALVEAAAAYRQGLRGHDGAERKAGGS